MLEILLDTKKIAAMMSLVHSPAAAEMGKRFFTPARMAMIEHTREHIRRGEAILANERRPGFIFQPVKHD